MKSLATLLVLSVLVVFTWTGSAPGPTAASPAPGGGPTGALGLMPDPNYGPGTHMIDLGTTGTYDAERWMVILDYESFTVQAGAVVTFLNHETRAPVVIRATGPIVIGGTLDLRGGRGRDYNEPPSFAEPGPGGFRGGRGSMLTARPSAGFGPGGGHLVEPGYNQTGGGGSHASVGSIGSGAPPAPVYGSPSCQTLLGGSGGAAGDMDPTNFDNAGGGAGGGAILIGSDVSVAVSGSIFASGGVRGEGTPSPSYQGHGGYGSGGSIRIFAPEIDLSATSVINAIGGHAWLAGNGRVRLEVESSVQQDGDPNPHALGVIGPEPSTVWTLGEFVPADPPTVRIVAWFNPDAGPSGSWVDLPADPRAALEPAPWADLQLGQSGPTLFRIEGQGVPVGRPLHVRVGHTRGQATFISSHSMGEVAGSTDALSWSDVSLDLDEGVSAIQVRAELP